MIPNQEEKFETLLTSLEEKPSEQIMFNAFLETYPQD